MIKNLNQLRRTLREGTQLEILDHCRPECIGQIWRLTSWWNGLSVVYGRWKPKAHMPFLNCVVNW